MEPKNNIGERLKELRKQRKLTLKQVGDHLHLTSAAISCYESGTRKPSHEVIQKLADLYQTTSDSILGIQNDNTNLHSFLNNSNLHWDGIPLREDELNMIKMFLELRVRDKEEAQKNIKNESAS